MIIRNNSSALTAYNASAAVQSQMAKTIERLSTGLRVNSAADDAAGLAISEKMRAQINGLEQAGSNAQDGISMIKTAEGALNEVHSILQRIRELSVQAANDTLTWEDRSYIQLEVDQLREEINRISATTQFNRKKLLDGSADVLWSADKLGVGVNIKGGLVSVDQFGQVSETEGNYRVSVRAVNVGRGQVLKSNIFTHIDDPGLAGETAAKMSKLRYISNFIDDNGNFMLDTPQTLTVSFDGGDTASFIVYGDDSLNDLGLKMQAAINEASGVTRANGSPVQFVGRDMDARSIEASYKLASSWLENSASRIQQYYGLIGTGGKLAICAYNADDPDDEGWVNAHSGAYNNYNGFLTFNLDHMNPYIDLHEPWDTINDEWYDRIVAAGLTHAVTFSHEGIARTMRMTATATEPTTGLWLVDGLAGYIPGTNHYAAEVLSKSGSDAQYLTDIKRMITSVFEWQDYDKMYEIPDPLRSNLSQPIIYPASYLAVRYFDHKGSGGNGEAIASLLNELKETGGTAAALNEAIDKASKHTFSDCADFLAQLLADDAFLLSVAHEDFGFDTGAVGGYYATEGKEPPLDSVHVIGDSAVFKINPLEHFGWSGIDWYGESEYLDIWHDRIRNSIPQMSSPPDPYDFFFSWEGLLSPHMETLSASLPQNNALQSVKGTLLIHSPVAGTAGKITVSGDENLIKALGLAEIQQASDTIYEVTITDAHSGKLIASGFRMSGDNIMGAIHQNINITLPRNFALTADGSGTLYGGYGSYKFFGKTEDFILHIASNATILQIGANEREIFHVNFGDVSAKALGLDALQLTSHETAARAIRLADNAIGIVSSMRARFGAYQNRLGHAINNLTTYETNLTGAESQIRDADMAREMMEFTKLNILSQSSVSMLAQANQTPQNILALLK